MVETWVDIDIHPTGRRWSWSVTRHTRTYPNYEGLESQDGFHTSECFGMGECRTKLSAWLRTRLTYWRLTRTPTYRPNVYTPTKEEQ